MIKRDHSWTDCLGGLHEWEACSWGVIIGLSRCKRCGKLSGNSDFPPPGRPVAGADW